MKLISRHIAYLLRRHDCVIVSGVGAFVADECGAEFAADGKSLRPMTRQLTFNPSITHDDGLLAASVAREQRISFEQGALAVGNAVTEMRKRLSLEGSVEIPRVGVLTLHRGRYDFHPAVLTAGVWRLPVLQLQPIAEAVPTVEINNDAAVPVAVVRVPLLKRTWLKVAASVAVLVTLGLALSTPIHLEQAHKASLDGVAFTAPAEPTVETLAVPDGLALNMALPAEKGLTSVKPEPEQPHRYVMVVASLPTRAQADNYVAANGGNVLEKDGKYRVYMASGATQADAVAAAQAIPDFESRYPGAWVCRK